MKSSSAAAFYIWEVAAYESLPPELESYSPQCPNQPPSSLLPAIKRYFYQSGMDLVHLLITGLDKTGRFEQ